MTRGGLTSLDDDDDDDDGCCGFLGGVGGGVGRGLSGGVAGGVGGRLGSLMSRSGKGSLLSKSGKGSRSVLLEAHGVDDWASPSSVPEGRGEGEAPEEGQEGLLVLMPLGLSLSSSRQGLREGTAEKALAMALVQGLKVGERPRVLDIGETSSSSG